MFNLRAEDKGLSFSVERRDNVPQYVVADGSKLRQVLINLLSNAVKFTEKGRVTLRIEMAPGTEQKPLLIFEVEDTGMGIAAEEMNMLFQHFQQTQAGRKSGSGTGLGLAISREFVRLMGGEITVTSMPGKGSIFRFEVQAENGMERIIDKSSLKIPARQVLRLKPEQSLYRVLIVDDKKDNRELLSLLLDSVGFETRQSSSGADGIKDFEEWKPHLILMDMRMPEMDGVETIRHIRAMAGGKKVKILSLTASTFMEDREKALSVGADDFLGKPFIESELFEKIRDLLQVEYLYAGPEVSAGALSAIKSSAEIGAMLVSVNLPGGLISELRQAVLEGDLDRMLDIISRINGYNGELAGALRALAEHFEYQKLQNILANFKK
jgi:two-component system sensor histidine kinase/response regulator